MKAKLKVHRLASNSETGANHDYKKFVVTRNLDHVFLGAGGEKLSASALVSKLRTWEYDLPPEINTVEAVEEWLQESRRTSRDNTYNWSWWGPTINFLEAYEYKDKDPHDPVVVIARAHHGMDVRAGYGPAKAYYLETAVATALLRWELIVDFRIDGKFVSLQGENFEAYRFIVNDDETGKLSANKSFTLEEIKRILDIQSWPESASLFDL